MAKEKENAGTAAREAPAGEGTRAGQEAAPPEVVNVRPIEPRGKLIGMADVRIGGLVVEGFKVFNGDKGLWVGPPSVPDNSTRSGYRRTARITDEKLQAVIDGKALEGYNAAVEKLVARAAAVRTVPEKPSIREGLREGAEQAARETARQGAKAAKKTAAATGRIARAALLFVKRHPVVILLLAAVFLLLMLLQSCMGAGLSIVNGLAGGIGGLGIVRGMSIPLEELAVLLQAVKGGGAASGQNGQKPAPAPEGEEDVE